MRRALEKRKWAGVVLAEALCPPYGRDRWAELSGVLLAGDMLRTCATRPGFAKRSLPIAEPYRKQAHSMPTHVVTVSSPDITWLRHVR